MNEHLTEREQKLLAVAEYFWTVVANVSGGDWNKQSQDWQEAAAKARDDFHNLASELKAKVA